MVGATLTLIFYHILLGGNINKIIHDIECIEKSRESHDDDLLITATIGWHKHFMFLFFFAYWRQGNL